MSLADAQGRLKGRAPVSVIDIGSNSVRLVVYEGVARAPTILFNEKTLVGLGRGLAASNRLDAKAVEKALACLRRYRALSDQAGAATVHALATAAARVGAELADFDVLILRLRFHVPHPGRGALSDPRRLLLERPAV